MKAAISGARAALAAAVWLAGCQGKREATPEPARSEAAPATSQPNSARARWVRVKAATDEAAEQLPARVVPEKDANAALSPPLPARVVKIHVAPGDQVKRGEVLFTVAMPEAAMASAVQASSGALAQALQKRRDQLKALQAEGLTRSADLFAVELDLARAQGERARAAATLRGVGGDASTLRSPIDGVVTEVKALVGEWRGPEGGPLARVAAARARRVEARLPSAPQGDGRYQLESGGKRWPLSAVASAPRAEGDGYLLWLDAPEGAQLAPGAARVLLLPPPGALAVPSRSVGVRDGKAFVLTRRGDGATLQVPVEVLRTAGAEALVRGAIEAGAQVSEAPHEAGESP